MLIDRRFRPMRSLFPRRGGGGVIPLLVLAAYTAQGCVKGESETRGPAGGGGEEPPPVPVETAVARTETVIDAISATGEIEAVQSVELRSEIEGRLVEILVREGREVARGTPLFKIDDREIAAQVARLQAQRDLAAQSLRRARELVERNASSAADLEEAEANARSTEAELRLQELRLAKTVVRAPFAGVVGERVVSVGDYVTNGTPLTTLQTVNPQRAAFEVPERFAGQLAVGQEVSFRVASADREFSGVVDFVDPVVKSPGRTITVKARVPNPDRVLTAGMFIEARLATEVRQEAVVVPEDAVLPLQGATFMWVVSEGTAGRRRVELGVRIPGFVEVLKGVDAGEQVVVGGLERLFEGAPVVASVVDRRAPAPPPESD